jgi:tRNA(Ile)-lysidine synthase
MNDKIQQAIKANLERISSDNIFIAYSGGIDSQVLLHACYVLAEQKFINKITLCHIHHGLSKHADTWQVFAKQQSDIYQAKFLTAKVFLNIQSNKSLEEQAREARYQQLVLMTSPNDVVLTGHHNDDQAETFLLALKRGAGTKGLSAMAKHRHLAERHLVRPLLDISRAEIEAYAEKYQLKWIDDDSNQDTRFDRNFLRHEIFPELTKRWPAIKQTIARSAQHCSEAQTLIDEVAEQDLAKVWIDDTHLAIDKLLTLSHIRLKNVLRHFLSKNDCLLPSQQQLLQVINQLSVAEDKCPSIKINQYYVRRYQGQLVLTPHYKDISDWRQNITLASLKKQPFIEMFLPDNVGKLTFSVYDSSPLLADNEYVIAVPKNISLMVQFNHNNPTCLPDYRQHHRKLKKLFQEISIAPWLRKRQVLLHAENELVAVLGRFICQPYLVEQADKKQTFLLKIKAEIHE